MGITTNDISLSNSGDNEKDTAFLGRSHMIWQLNNSDQKRLPPGGSAGTGGLQPSWRALPPTRFGIQFKPNRAHQRAGVHGGQSLGSAMLTLD